MSITLIDTHTHAFPESIAPRAVSALMAGVLREEGRELPPRGEATVSGLCDCMRREDVALSIVLPIATAPHQTEGILRFAEQINAQSGAAALRFLQGETEMPSAPLLLSFASLHPEESDPLGRLEEIKERGFLGIKLHPEFQNFYIDSPLSVRILRRAEELSLCTVVHAGADIGMPPPVHCTPERLSHVLEEIRGEHLVAAHLGGFRRWEEVLTHLAGKPLYFDTAYIGADDGEPSAALYREIVRTHGAHKILFGSDYPWKSPREVLTALSAVVGEGELPLICSENARKIFGITASKQ